jgi:hypothetical protein
MLSKVSTFVGPSGFFSSGGGTPSLVLSLDAVGYTGSGVWFDLSTFDNDGISDGSVSLSNEGGGSFDFDGSSAYFFFGKSNYTFNPSTSSTYGVTFSSNSVTSIDPTGNWDTKQAVSSESYSGGIRLKFQTGGTNPFLMCGLSDSPDDFIVNYSKPNYGFYVQGTNFLTIVEDGDFNVNPMSGTYSNTTNYIITWDGSDVKFYVDDVLVYTSMTTPTNPLYLYCTFLNSEFSINNIEFGPYAQGIPIGNSPFVQGLPIGNSQYTMEAWFKSDSYDGVCNLSLGVSSQPVSSWIDDLNSLYPSNYLSVGIWNGTGWVSVEKILITGTLVFQDIIDFFDGLPNVTCVLDDVESWLNFVWNEVVGCGYTYTLKIAITDSSFVIIVPQNEGDPQICDCVEVVEKGSLVSWGLTGTSNYSNGLRLNNNGITNYWWDNDINVNFTGSQSLYLDNWYYVAATYDGTNRKIYLNGNQVALDTPPTPPSVDDISTLKIGYDGINYFNGKISKVKVHTKALSSAKILSNFNADKVRHGAIFGSMTFSSADKSYLISNSNDYIFATNDFTIEAFVKLQLSTELYGGIVSFRPFDNSYISINSVVTNTSTPLIEFQAGGVYYNFTASNDTWYHTAISRVSGTTSFYVNGDLLTEITDNNVYNAFSDVVVGRYHTDVDDYYTEGLISNVRIVNGTGLYSGPSITIPDTPLSSISNTELLIISQQTSPTLDVSGNLQTVTASNIGWTSSLPSFAPPYTTEGLELYVDAGISTSYPGSGTTLFDLSPNGFNMFIGTGSTWSSDPSGGVLYFDGSYSGQIDLDGPVSSNIVSVTHSTGYTMEVMVNFDSVSSSQGIFTFCGNVWGSSGYIDLQLENSTLRWEVAQGYNRTSGTFSSSTWYNITATYDGTNLLEIFVNGVLIGTHTVLGTSPHTSTSAKFVLGMWDGPLVGKIGFARFYSRELTSEEVLSNFEN